MATQNKSDNKQLLSELAEVLVKNELNEVEYQQGEVYIKLTKGGRAVEVAMPTYAPQMAPMAAPAPVSAPVSAPVVSAPAPVANPADNPKAIKSPMVGVAYLTPEPSSPNYVKVGDTVSVGQTLLLVEAMKTFNPVKSPRAGKVTAIMVNNGSPVEYDEPLMIIE
ncbi:MAG: Biotin carboxyl carrier protein of acetyl-CoA carboxylase [Firmicutes bacterium ADurb.Bin419]|nr:MAG: Biotin carboxyl carrier protein of acetyl-CoA carboxylase [Firmicutes bacterium ADurb.Bin419]